MKTDKIEELFNRYCSLEDKEVRPEKVLYYWDFTTAIKQAELEWYKKLESKLNGLWSADSMIVEFINYRNEIRNKIKELENGI